MSGVGIQPNRNIARCEYVNTNKFPPKRCPKMANVIVASEGGKDPQALCSEHEAIVAEISFYEKDKSDE